MFGPKAKTDHPRRDAPQDREALQEPQGKWKAAQGSFVVQGAANNTLVRENLKPLRHARGELAASLDRPQPFVGHSTPLQRAR